MTTRKQIAELAAVLALRCPLDASTQLPAHSAPRIGDDALKLARYGAAATTNATALCNGWKASITKHADAGKMKHEANHEGAEESGSQCGWLKKKLPHVAFLLLAAAIGGLVGWFVTGPMHVRYLRRKPRQ